MSEVLKGVMEMLFEVTSGISDRRGDALVSDPRYKLAQQALMALPGR